VARLAGLPKLASLNLGGTKVGDPTLETLGRCDALRAVDLSFTPMSDAALAAFGKSHPRIVVTR
jgi:hypothetical protein